MPRYDVPNAAPEPLRLVQEFVNSVDVEHGSEWLPDPAALERWLEERGLGKAHPTRADVERAHRLREALRALLRENNGIAADRDAAAVVDGAARDARLTAQLAGLRPLAGGVRGGLGGVLAVAFAAMADGTWERLKACRQCGWSFYDYSRNRSATWCSMSLCGNRLKTRAYRHRSEKRR